MVGLLDFGQTEEEKKQNLGLLGLLVGGQIMAANQPGATTGQAIGAGFNAGAQGAMQMQQQAGARQMRDLQMRKLRGEIDRGQVFQTMLGGNAPSSALPGVQTENALPAAGVAPGLPPVGATPTANPFEKIPQHIRMAALAAGPEEGPKILANYITQTQKPASVPSAITEYEYAKAQGYPGTFAQFQQDQRKAGATTVNVGPTGVDYGSPGEGLVWQRDKNNQIVLDERGAPIAIPFKGGKAFRALEKEGDADVAKTEQVGRYGDIVLTDLARARQKIQNAPWYSPTTGMVGNILKDLGGTPAADVKALTSTVRANIGFDRLQAMREASPTGGALGNVTERELSDLQATLGSLEQSQTEAQLLENLDRLEKVYGTIMRKASAYPNAGQFGFEPVAPKSNGATGSWSIQRVD